MWIRYRKSLSFKVAAGIIAAILLTMTLVVSSGCNAGGARIKIAEISLGEVAVDGKPVVGMPSDKINLLLEVSAQEITINYGANGTVLTVAPSGATVEITAGGIRIKDVSPEQIKVEWVISQKD